MRCLMGLALAFAVPAVVAAVPVSPHAQKPSPNARQAVDAAARGEVDALVAQADRLLLAGKSAESIAVRNDALRLAESTFGPEHESTVEILSTIALWQKLTGDSSEAQRLAGRASPLWDAVLAADRKRGPSDPKRFSHLCLASLVNVFFAPDSQKTTALLNEALEVSGTLSFEEGENGTSACLLAQVCLLAGRLTEAGALFGRGIPVVERKGGRTLFYYSSLGDLYNQQGLYAEAVRAYRRAAEAGNALGAFGLGCAYEHGKGVRQDYEEALRWYRAAAEQGLAQAQTAVGYFYAKGLGVSRDPVESVKWTRMAADKGDAIALINLSLRYLRGDAVDQNTAEALRLMRLAASTGNADAEFQLAAMYQQLNQPAEALAWVRQAAERGHPLAAATAGDIYYFGRGVAPDHAEAFRFYVRAAEKGDANAASSVGISYLFGDGTNQDTAKATEWLQAAATQRPIAANMLKVIACLEPVFPQTADGLPGIRQAADKGEPWAENLLGYLYQMGWHVPRDLSQALSWYRKAAERRCPEGQKNLGWLYEYGLGVQKDTAVAVGWYHKGAEGGSAIAMFNLAHMYASGVGVAPDDQTALEWFRKSAERGYPDAFPRVGMMYLQGRGVPRSDTQAYAWFAVGASLGNPEARSRANELFGSLSPQNREEADRVIAEIKATVVTR
jgi:hypothetical protein